MAGKKPSADWVPDRQEVIWIDCTRQAGREMRDLHPFLVLSPRRFNARTAVVIGLPMTTADHNADHPFAVVVGTASGRKTGKTSYALCHQPKSFDWRARGAAPHRLGRIPDERFAEACETLDQILMLSRSES